MAMTGTGMAAQVKANIQALPGFAGSNFLRDDVLIAFCDGVVEYIQANADIKAGIESQGPDPQGGTVTVISLLQTAGIA